MGVEPADCVGINIKIKINCYLVFILILKAIKEKTPMEKKIAYLGLDVHKKSYSAALFRIDKSTVDFEKKISSNIRKVIEFCKELSKEFDLRICYEAGSTGYKLYRKCIKANLNCSVIAPSSLPKNFKRKNDKIDAKNLANYLKSGVLQKVNVPDIELEEDRDLVRLREAKVKNVIQAKLRIKSFLLRKGIDYDIEKTWSKKFYDWLASVELSLKDRQNLNRLLNDLKYSTKFLSEIESDIFEISESMRYQKLVDILRGFRGIETTTAMNILTHIVDFRTFDNPKYIASFVGVTPGFSNSGESKRSLSITRAGNTLLRKAFVNAAQHYSRAKSMGSSLRQRREKLSSGILDVINRCDKRCYKTYWKLVHSGKNHNIAKTAVARELIHFVWESMMVFYNGELKKNIRPN